MNINSRTLKHDRINQVVDNKLHAHTDDMVKRIGQMDDLVKRYTGGYGEAIETLDEIRFALPQTASGGDFILQYNFFYMSQKVRCDIHLIWLTADFAVFLIDELPRVSEIFTAFGEIGVHLLYCTSFKLLIECRTGDADLLGDSHLRQPLLQERLYFTSLISG